MSEESAKIAVIGLGNAGLPLAAVVADSGIMVMGVDINEERCRQINRGENPIPEEAGLEELIKLHGGKRLVATSHFEDARGCQTFIVIVPVFVDAGNNPDFSIMEKRTAFSGQDPEEGRSGRFRDDLSAGNYGGPGAKPAMRVKRPICRATFSWPILQRG